jgi:hypothetical protein
VFLKSTLSVYEVVGILLWLIFKDDPLQVVLLVETCNWYEVAPVDE